MSCNIHLWVEARENENSPWKLQKPQWMCGLCQGEGKIYPTRDDDDEIETCQACEGTGWETEFVGGGYYLYSMLAGVRNGTRGCEFVPISEPRGFPKGMSEELLEELKDYDRHSQSWLTIAEIDEYFSVPKYVISSGYMRGYSYAAYLHAKHLVWTYDDIRDDAIKLSEEQAVELMSKGEKLSHKHAVLVEQRLSYREAAGFFFLQIFLGVCRKLSEKTSDIRLVFDFED